MFASVSPSQIILFRIHHMRHVNGYIVMEASCLMPSWKPISNAYCYWIGSAVTVQTKVHIVKYKDRYIIKTIYNETLWNNWYEGMLAEYRAV